MKHRWLLIGLVVASAILGACAPGGEGGATDAASSPSPSSSSPSSAPSSSPSQAEDPDDYGY